VLRFGAGGGFAFSTRAGRFIFSWHDKAEKKVSGSPSGRRR